MRRNEDSGLLVLVAGPYRSGTGDDLAKLAANCTSVDELPAC